MCDLMTHCSIAVFPFPARLLVPYGLGSLSSMMDYRQLGQEVSQAVTQSPLLHCIPHIYHITSAQHTHALLQ